MHFSLTYFSAAFLIFACLAPASPVPADSSSSGPSTTPTIATQYPGPTVKSIVVASAGDVYEVGEHNVHIAAGSKALGFFIVEKIIEETTGVSSWFSHGFRPNKGEYKPLPSGIKYHGTFVTPDVVKDDISGALDRSWTSKMPKLFNLIQDFCDRHKCTPPTTMLAYQVKIYKDEIEHRERGLIDDGEYAELLKLSEPLTTPRLRHVAEYKNDLESEYEIEQKYRALVAAYI